MGIKPRPGTHNYCPACMGWGAHTVNNSTDYEDELACLDCNGTGIRQATNHENRARNV